MFLSGGSSQVDEGSPDLTQGALSGAGSRADLGKGGVRSRPKGMGGQAMATRMK